MNASIITARAGSKSILDKNVYEVAGAPLLGYPIQASLDGTEITDDNVQNWQRNLGYVPQQIDLSDDTTARIHYIVSIFIRR